MKGGLVGSIIFLPLLASLNAVFLIDLLQTRSLAPATPLTGRRYLKDKDQCHVTPVSTATQSVSRLQALLSGRKTSPSDFLIEEFKWVF